MSDPSRVAVVGVTGYAGFELARLLLRHPHIEKTTFYLRDANANVHCLTDLFPQLRGWGDASCKPLSVEAIASSGADVVFLSTPHEASLELVPALLTANPIAANRGPERCVPIPAGRDLFEVVQAAGAGCECSLPSRLRPAGALRRQTSESADRRQSWLLSHVGDSWPEAAGRGRLDRHVARHRGRLQVRRHRRGQRAQARHAFRRSEREFPRLQPVYASAHAGSVRASRISGRKMSFSPRICCRSIAEFSRRSMSGWVLRAKRRKSRRSTANFTRGVPMVRIMPAGELPELQYVTHTNFCDIGFALDLSGERLVIVSCLDNLGKGAAGQAMQNLNGMRGYPETAGLL